MFTEAMVHVTLIYLGGTKLNHAKSLLQAQIRQSWEGSE